MTSVCFATFCHPPHLPRLHAEGQLERMIATHRYPFDEVIVVHQRCRDMEYRPFDDPGIRIVESEDYPDILIDFNIPEYDEAAEHYTHGSGGAHYWKFHVINHLIILKEATSDYIVFSDCDCDIRESPTRSWVEEGIDILKRYQEVLIISPGDGAQMFEKKIPEARLTQNVSQQLFLAMRERLLRIDFNAEWDGKFNCAGGPFPEYYFLMEGRLWRWMKNHDLWRAILPDTWRYWHWQY